MWSAHLSSKGHRGKAQEYATEQQRQQQQEAANQARQQEQDAEQSRKRSAIDEELDEEAQPKRQRVNGSSPIPEHSQDQPAAVPEEEEDAEWAALERDILAEPVIPSSTNMSSQPGVISAAPKLIDPNNPPESDEGTPAEPKEVDEDEPKETEDERRERENNEELMLRIDE